MGGERTLALSRRDALARIADQDAVFQIEGPDEDGSVWLCSPDGLDVRRQNLGPKDKVVEVLSEWLGSVDADEAERT
jgi:hypothetical protein